MSVQGNLTFLEVCFSRVTWGRRWVELSDFLGVTWGSTSDFVGLIFGFLYKEPFGETAEHIAKAP